MLLSSPGHSKGMEEGADPNCPQVQVKKDSPGRALGQESEDQDFILLLWLPALTPPPVLASDSLCVWERERTAVL